jgi:hypothetical protein
MTIKINAANRSEFRFAAFILVGKLGKKQVSYSFLLVLFTKHLILIINPHTQ